MSESAALEIALIWEGEYVRNWRVGAKGAQGESGVTVRESARAPRVYLCLTCIKTTCEHAKAVEEFDR